MAALTLMLQRPYEKLEFYQELRVSVLPLCYWNRNIARGGKNMKIE
jgi:hypothetical protein